MATLYLLIFGSTGMENEDTTTTTESSKAIHPNDESLAELLQRPNTTIEEFWVALFQAGMNHQNPYVPDGFALASSNSNSNNASLLLLRTHLPTLFGILLPWLLVVILGIVLPCAVLLRELYKRGVCVSDKRRRKKKLLKRLEEYKKILSPPDWVDPKKHDNDDDIDHDNVGRWKLPLAGAPLPLPLSGQSHQKERGDALLLERHVVGNCAICLTEYACGETLTWSSNPKCVHCFHQDCIVSWLSKRRNREQTPCPCCRQSFVVVTTKLPN
jgi:hypothetical protein